MANIRETDPAPLDEEFKQGDILHFFDRHHGSGHPTWGVIINADCDLAHCKIDGVVSYLPIYTFEDYFIRFWIPTYLDNRRADVAQQLCAVCDLPPDKSEELVQWLREEEFSSVLGKCLNQFHLRKGQVEPKLKELSIITSASDLDVDVLLRVLAVHGQPVGPQLEKLARTALRGLGDGQFFLNEIHGLPELGYVVRMRRIYAISAEHVFRSFREFSISNPGETNCGVRIARLSSLYRFKVAQIFAHQFSRIGLPDEITILNTFAAEAAISSLVETSHA
jgi:hypothetical protein